MQKETLVAWAKSHGYTEDRYGYLTKQVGERQYRLKISNIAARYEMRVHHPAGEYSKASSEWVRLRSGYLRDIRITEDDKLAGMR